VFAADSEEAGVIRKSTEKIAHNKKGVASYAFFGGKCPAIVVAGAGNATLIDYATQEILSLTHSLTTVTEIELKISEILQRIHSVNVPLHPVADPLDAAFELLIGIKHPDFSPFLYSSQGATLVRRDTYYVCGTGLSRSTF